MEYTGCFDAVEDVVSEATEQYGGRYTLNKELYEKLPDICRGVDELFEEIECLCLDVSVYDVPHKRVAIEIICEEMVLQHGREHVFFRVFRCLIPSPFQNQRMGTCAFL